MKDKIYTALQRIYGAVMTAAFFGGLLPLFGFLFAIAVGGGTGEAVTLFLYKQYYPIVIALASIGVLIGLIAMYIGNRDGFSSDSEEQE